MKPIAEVLQQTQDFLYRYRKWLLALALVLAIGLAIGLTAGFAAPVIAVVVAPLALKLGIGAVGTAVVLGVGASVASGAILGMGYLANRAHRWFRRDNLDVFRASTPSPASSPNKAASSTDTKSGWIRGLMKRMSGWFRGEQESEAATPVLAQATNTDKNSRHHPLNTPSGSTSSSHNGSPSGEHSSADESDHGSHHTAVISHPTTRSHSPEIPKKPGIAALGAQLKAVEKQLEAASLTPAQIEDCCQQVETINKSLKACSLAYHPDKTGDGDHAMMQVVNDCRETFRRIKTRLEEIQAQETGNIHKLTSLLEQLNVLEREIDEQAIKLNEQAAELKEVKAEQALQFQTLMAKMERLEQGRSNDAENRADPQAGPSGVRTPMVMQAPHSRRSSAEVEVNAIIPIEAGEGELSPAGESDQGSTHTAVTLHPSSRPSSLEIPKKPDIAALSAQLKKVERQLKAEDLTPAQIEDCCQQVEAIAKDLKACSLAYHPDKTGDGDHEMMQVVNGCRETFKNIKARLEEIQTQEPGNAYRFNPLLEQLDEIEREIERQWLELEKIKTAQAAELASTNAVQAAQTLQIQALIATVQSLKQEIGNRADIQAGPSGVRTPIVMQAPRSRRNSAEAEEVPAMPAASADTEAAQEAEGLRSRRNFMSLSSGGEE